MNHRCIVIGAGIIGSALAARLAEAGAQVTIIEALSPGGGTSKYSLAWINSNGKPPRRYHDLNVAGIHAWRQLATRLGNDWLKSGGSLHWRTAQDADQLIEHVKELRAWEYPAQILSPSQALGLEPSLTLPSDVGEIAYFPEEAYLLTTPAITTLLQYAKSRGATLISNDPVAELLMTSNRLYGVKLVSGIRIEADTVALCTGWRTPTLAAQIDIDVPLTPVDLPGSTAPCLIAYTTPVRDGLTRLICGPGFSARPDENGRVFLEIDDLDEPINLTPDADQLAAYARILFQRARTILPSLAEATIAEHRLCILPLPSDGYPIIGRPPAIEGCYVIVTHSGVTLAAHLATLAATEILTQIDHPTLAPYRLQRF